MPSPFVVHFTRPGSLLPEPHRVQAETIDEAITSTRDAHPGTTIVGAQLDTWEAAGPLSRRDDYRQCWRFRESNDVFWIRHDNVTARVIVSPFGLAATFTPIGLEDFMEQSRPHASLSFADAAEQALAIHRRGAAIVPAAALFQHRKVLEGGALDVSGLSLE